MLDGGAPERVNGQRVSPTFFSMLGVRPALGRDFNTAEDTPGTNQVVIISHGLWERRFGGDSSIVGKPISINGAAYLLAGVLPASYESVIQPGAEIWRVLGYDNAHGSHERHYRGKVTTFPYTSYEALLERFLNEVRELREE